MVWTALTLAIVVASISAAAWPSLIEQGRDSTIFAYFGYAVTEGVAPYRAVWDHKPPLVFAVNTLAFLVFGPSREAIWIITTINTVLVCWVFFLLAQRLTGGKLWAWLGAVCLALLVRNPAVAGDGNYTETYALLPNVAMLLAGWSFLCQPRAGLAVAVGAGAALAALGRPTFIGAALALWPAIVLARDPLLRQGQWRRWLVAMVAGGTGTIAAVLIVLAAWGILHDALDATLFFNAQAYGGRSLADRIIGGLEGQAVLIVLGPLLPLALGAAGLLGWRALRVASRTGARRTMRLWLASGFIADLLLANVSGQGFSHYYVVVFPQLV